MEKKWWPAELHQAVYGNRYAQVWFDRYAYLTHFHLHPHSYWSIWLKSLPALTKCNHVVLFCHVWYSRKFTGPKGFYGYDTLRFFIGAHPATQFKMGTQMGGRYKCRGCGCKEDLMDNHVSARRTADLEYIAIRGVLENSQGKTHM